MNSQEEEKEIISIEFVKSTGDWINPNITRKAVWKQEGNDWKPKKNNFQKLETVLEEVQSPCDGTFLKQNDNSEEKIYEVYAMKQKKFCHDLRSIKEHFNFSKPEDAGEGQEEQQEQLLKRQKTDESIDKMDSLEGEEDIMDSRSIELNMGPCPSPRNMILNGVVEILPIFSNDKFVSSRDTLSVEEYELESVERSCSRKPLPEGKRSMEFRCKIFADLITTNPSHSPFINFLLVLSQFSAEREKLLGINEIRDCNHEYAISDEVLRSDILGGNPTRTFSTQIFYIVTLAVFFLLSIMYFFLNFYKPSCIVAKFIRFKPLIQRKRTYIRTLFNQIIKIIH